MSKRFITMMLLSLFLGAAVMGVHAADLYVTTTDDQVAGSLRAVISTANSNGEDDTIHLPAGLYLLTGTADEDGNLGGDLDIDNEQAITILGEDVKNTFIDGNHLDRVIHILSGTVSIQSVTIQNGKTSDGDDEKERGGDGGGVYNCGKLSLTDCSIVDNTCGAGYKGWYHITVCGCPGNGGYGGGIYNIGKLTLTRCTIKNNLAGRCGRAITGYCCPDPTNGGHGGGIFNGSAGSQKLVNCTISNNGSGEGHGEGLDEDDPNNGGEGGGIYNSGSQELINCRINGNHTGRGYYGGRCGYGGGIYNSGKSNIENSFITNNTTIFNEDNGDYVCYIGDGGGIYNCGSLTLTAGTIDKNFTAHGGSGAGIHHHSGTLTLIRCSITNNNTGDGVEHYGTALQGGNGAGIFNKSAMNITNCTIGGNTTGTGAGSNYISTGGNGGDGAGICSSGSLTLENSTICQNFTGAGGMGDDKKGRPGNGGGICNLSGTVQLKNTIVANNATATGGKSEDAWGTLSSNGYNLIENTMDCSITGILTGNITGVDPLLGPLTKNGGPTQTYALLSSSPAIDAGNSAGISTDQRGYTRPVDIPSIPNVSDGSDIGAYELQSMNSSVTISGAITYGGKGLAGVTLTFSSQGGTTTTDNDGNYSHVISGGWTGTVTPSLPGYTFTPTNRSYTNVTAEQQDQDYSAAAINPPRIALDRTQLNFGADTSGQQTGMQTLTIANSGGGILTWSISDKAQWLNYTPTSGTGAATVTVTVDPRDLSAGTYTAAILVESPTAVNSPKAVPVTLTVYNADAINPPFGSFDTPLDGAAVTGSIPVTGWAIDDIGIESIKIYRTPVDSEGSDWIYIGDATRIEGARPDIETLYPAYPENYKAGWGYMLLTYSLPNDGNGTYTLYAKATDVEGNEATLGSKTITIDNVNAIKPFGALDTPIPGGTVPGENYVNYGWVLTPQPNVIPMDGSTIDVVIDGMVKGHPVYNIFRSDVAALFPGYANSDGAGGYFYIDTTKLKNGLHTIAWIVSDSGGNSDGIGSRYFAVQNLTNSLVQEKDNKGNTRSVIKSFDQTFSKVWPPAGSFIEIQELERVEINLSAKEVYDGYLVVGDQLRELPIGSTLDTDRGIFYWQPGPGFVGEYRFVFIEKDDDGQFTRNDIVVNIKSKQ